MRECEYTIERYLAPNTIVIIMSRQAGFLQVQIWPAGLNQGRRSLKIKQAKDPTPAAWKSGTLSCPSDLTLDIAKKMLEAGEKEAKKQGVPISTAISDAGGNLVAFSRMDNAAMFSIQIAMDKAFTAVFGKMPTGSFGSFYRTGELVPLFFHKRWITFPGGFPIVKNEILLGGIGVSGGTIEDVYVARAALEAGGFVLDDVDVAIATITGAAQKSRKK